MSEHPHICTSADPHYTSSL